MQWFRDLKVYQKIGLTIISIITLIVLLGVTNLIEASRINKRVNNLYTQELKPLITLNNVKGAMYRYRDRTLRYLLDAGETNSRRHLKHLSDQKERLESELLKYKNTRLSKEELEYLEKFEQFWASYISEVEKKVIPLALQGNVEKAKDIFFSSSLDKFRKARDSLNNLIKYQEKRANRRYINANNIYNNARNISIIILVSVIALSFGLGMNLVNSIRKPVKEVQNAIKKLSNKDLTMETNYNSKDELGETLNLLNKALVELNFAINEAKQVANDNSSVATELSVTISSVEKNVEDMAKFVQDIREQGENVTNVIDKTLQDAIEAKEIMADASEELRKSEEKIVEISNAVKVAAENELILSEKIKGFQKHSEEVRHIVKLISEIADQTDLLALNTAVEAARAGENGRGFGVVADEIRKLSKKIQDSLESIGKIIEMITSAIEDVSKQMEHNSKLVMELSENAMNISENIKNVVNKVTMAKNSYENVVHGFMENKASVEKIIEHIKEIGNIAISNARSVEEIARAADHLRSITEELRVKLEGFKTLNMNKSSVT